MFRRDGASSGRFGCRSRREMLGGSVCFEASESSVPEGRRDRSLARSAWNSAIPKNRPVGHGVIRAGVHRVDDWAETRSASCLPRPVKQAGTAGLRR
jgi:hypothetical protein